VGGDEPFDAIDLQSVGELLAPNKVVSLAPTTVTSRPATTTTTRRKRARDDNDNANAATQPVETIAAVDNMPVLF
jgi:hypothetical protein